MNKELTPLQALERVECNLSEDGTSDLDNALDTIKTALKRLEIYENYGIDLDETDDVEKALKLNAEITIADKVMNTQERLLTSISSDEIRILSSVLNSQIKKLKNKLKALEIIKEKEIDIFIFNRCIDVETYNDSNHQEISLTQGEFDLLKEVLL